MNDLEKAARMALEAICESGDFLFNFHDCEPNNEREMQAYQAALAANEKAFNALHQALSNRVEQPAQQEPVMWGMPDGKNVDKWGLQFYGGQTGTPLYTRPQPAEWNGLTQQDIDIAFDDTQEGGGFDEFARAIEAKLKEKNTGETK